MRITINVKEGSRAKIRQIELVGNTSFPDKEILSTLSLKTPTIVTFFNQNDRYSRETLQGDLEKIQGYFQDRGYANAHIESVQVAIAPDKKRYLHHGESQRGRGLPARGHQTGRQPDRCGSRAARSWSRCTRARSTRSTRSATPRTAIKNRLGAEGFYFAKVDPVPSVDELTKIVDLTLFVDPGNRVYVRHINFTGTTRSNDEPLRREMRQLEAAWLSNVAIERSKQRLQRLPYVESVDMTTEAVPGSPDLVDVELRDQGALQREHRRRHRLLGL